MRSDRTIYWLIITGTYMFMLGYDLLVATYPISLYTWRISSPRYLARSMALSPIVTRSVPICYKLDAWSQYDNPEEGSAREGDIKGRSVSRKTTTTNKNLLWSNGIVRYYIDDTIANEPEKLAILEAAMENIMEQSCVRFIRIYPDVNGTFPLFAWVNITGHAQGCFSDLGRLDVSPSNLNLDVRKCFRTRGHAIHEILHTLGVFHEHMRPDRDKYIEILWDNIKDGDEFNFRMMDNTVVTNYGLPYDYDSIMHYSMTAFSKDRSIPTIVPRQEGAEIGQRDHLSFYDVQKLMITYRCNDVYSEYMDEKMHQDHRDQAELLNLTMSQSFTSPPNRRSDTDRWSGPVDTLREYQSPYSWNPLTQYYYPEYLSNSFPADDYCYYYYY